MADTTSKVIRLTEYDLLRTSITPGRWYMTTDSRKCYKDTSEKQRKFVNVVQIPTEKQRMYETFTKVYGKLYYCWESSNLYTWNGRWELVVGNPEYPNSFQYIDGEIYSVSNYSDDVEGNGILGDGSVVIRDTNRIIKAQIYIDETNDNLVISSFLGGGIKVLPNGNMENTGALYLNPTTIGEDKDGLGTHFNEFENINGEVYVGYDSDHYDKDPNPYQNSDHRYMVWHQGNLDARGLLEGWYLLKNIDETSEGQGKTNIENTKDSDGLVLKSENPQLNSDVIFATHHFGDENSPILGELTGADKDEPLTNNAGLYVVKTAEGKIEIHLRKDNVRPTTKDLLNSNDELLTKGEAIELMNENIYSAVQTRINGDDEYYKINDESLIPLIKEGLTISVTFNKDTEKENLFLSIGSQGKDEIIDLNIDKNKKDRPICFKTGSIYQLIRTGDKWLFINPQMKATTENNGYGVIRVTGESADTSSFNVITDDIVDLDTIQYTYDGRYSFLGDINEGFNFPEEELSNVSDKEMQYVLDVRSSGGRGTSLNIRDNCIEQELSNINTGKKYLRYLNKSWYFRTTYEQGAYDTNGRNKTDGIRVRQSDILKVTPGLIYKFRHIGLTNIVQMSVYKINKGGKVTTSPYTNVSSTGISVLMDADTEYIRMVYQYQDKATQLNPLLIQGSKLLITIEGFSDWVKIYDENTLTDREKIGREIISLPSNKWIQNGNSYEQTFYRWNVTKDTLVEGNLDILNQAKLEVSHIESFNYGFKVVASALPTENIQMTVTYTESKEV